MKIVSGSSCSPALSQGGLFQAESILFESDKHLNINFLLLGNICARSKIFFPCHKPHKLEVKAHERFGELQHSLSPLARQVSQCASTAQANKDIIIQNSSDGGGRKKSETLKMLSFHRMLLY